MAYTFDPVFAVDPNNPANVAKNASITIFDPADATQAPITITDPTGVPLPNPITVDAAGMGPAYQHPTLARVGWKGAGFTGYFTSYEGMYNETQAAKSAAQEAAGNAGAAAQADLETRIASGVFKGEKGADGSNVLPTGQAIEQAIINDGPAKTAINATIASEVEASVPPLVTSALAADDAPAQAAAAAVSDAAAGLDLVESSDTRLPQVYDILNRPDIIDADVDASGVAFRWITTDGVTHTAGTESAVSTRAVVGWGDSLTAWPTSWPTVLPTKLSQRGKAGVTVFQRGVGSETSLGIAARQGAMPYLIKPNSGTIPSTATATLVSVVSTSGATAGTAWPLLRGNDFPVTMTGTIIGDSGVSVHGTLTLVQPAGASVTHQETDEYYFTRTTAGTAVPMTRPRALVLDDAVARGGDIAVIWAGRNNPSNVDRVVDDIRAMVKARDPQDADYLIVSVTNGAAEGTGTSAHTNITAVNNKLLSEYGRRFVDVRRYLIDYGIADVALTPTTQDNADIAADTIPASLRIDSIHLSDAAQGVVAGLIADRLIEIGAL